VTDSGPPARRPIVHRKPLPATIRQLYGTAFRCAKPSCGRPLYKMNNETGEIVLNSNVSHICARSEGGPRWDSEMGEEENRGESNLVPMCLEHALEIDATPEHYPVELLCEWKRAQIAEHFRMQKGWPLTDDEAQQVIEASFDLQDYGVAVAGASSVASAARAVGHLVETARQERQVPYEAAACEWHAMRMRAQQRLPRSWDAATGELLPPVEPSRSETMPFQHRLDAALQQVVETLRPLVARLVGELHAVRATATRVEPWCLWVEAAAQMVVQASGRWPGRPPGRDDAVLDDMIAELLRAFAALSAAWRGQPADQPPEPEPPAPEPVETDAQRMWREHQELLERARPWARVNTRPYDGALYMALVEAARFALDLPEPPMHLPVGLTATTGLAAEVARNADDVTLAALIDDAAEQRPLAISASLVRELMLTAESTQREDLRGKARHQVVQLLRDADWAKREAWVDNRFHVRRLLGWTASVTTDEEVRARIGAVITSQPDLLEPILLGISQYSERRDNNDWSQRLGVDVYIAELPSWLPISAMVAEIRRQYPDLQAADRYADTEGGNRTRELAAQVLHIESRSA
jgi:pterin-4a-carbinolamine dehydratase